MIYHLLVASLSVAVMAALWVAVQALVRRASPEIAEDDDVLACRTCAGGGSCGGCARSLDVAASGGATEIRESPPFSRTRTHDESDVEKVRTFSL